MNLKMNEVNFTGHVLTNKGLKRDPVRVEAITKMPKPQDIEGVQRLYRFVLSTRPGVRRQAAASNRSAIQCDASQGGLGAVIHQNGKPIE